MTDHKKSETFDSAVDLFGILSNQKRRQILRICSEQTPSPEQLSKVLKIGIMATKKHLSILQRSELVERKDSTVRTTQFGYGFLQNMSSFEFLNKHKNFFSEHRFGDITPRMLKRVGDLKNCDFYYGFHIVLPRWSRIAVQAKKYLNLVFLHPPIVIADSIKPRVDSGLKVRLLIGKNSNITECNEFVKNLDLHKPINHSNFEKRRCRQVQVNLIMSEKEACVIFPNNNGITDMHGNFISKDPDFVGWCHDFFESKWKDGEPVSRLR